MGRINLNWAGGSVPCNMVWNGEYFRNAHDKGSVEEKAFLEECKNTVRKELGAIDEDEVYFLPNCSTAITIVMNSFDTCFSDVYSHHAVYIHDNYVGTDVDGADGELYCAVTVNAETGLYVADRKDMERYQDAGKAVMLDISQSVGKKEFCFSVEPCNYAVMTVRKNNGWNGAVLLVKHGSPELKPLVKGSQDKLFGGTQDLINAAMCTEGIKYHNYNEHYEDLWWEAKSILCDEEEGVGECWLGIPSTFTLYGDFPAEIIKQNLIEEVDFSTGSICNDGSMAEEPFRKALGMEGKGLIRLSFGPTTKIEDVRIACEKIRKEIKEII